MKVEMMNVEMMNVEMKNVEMKNVGTAAPGCSRAAGPVLAVSTVLIKVPASKTKSHRHDR